MAVRDDFAPGEVLASADLNDTFASKLPYSFGTATPSTTDSGFLWYDSNSTPAAPKFWDGAAFQALTSGKILQVVRATDSTQRSTTSTAMTDANISVTITPTKTTSAVLLVWSVRTDKDAAGSDAVRAQITDSSNNPISGAEESSSGSASGTLFVQTTLFAYATPATTSAVTYKGRFRSQSGGSMILRNQQITGQLYALEIAA
jgi:hypothetical protein